MRPDLHAWDLPARVLFGEGAVSEVGEAVVGLGAERAFVVTDEGVRSAGVLDPMFDSIEDAGGEYAVFDGVSPDPDDELVGEIADAYGAADADLVLGAGGGSSMDAAKAAAVVASNGGDILDYRGSGRVEEATPPMIQVPTTAGTGSEVGKWCIVTDSETSVKEEIGDVELLANLAVVDPSLTASVPPAVKAATGMDVLVHAIEAYVSIKRRPHTSALALDAVEQVGGYLPRAVEYRGGDDEALRAMAGASFQAGMAFNGAGLGAVHALSHQIGGVFGVPHGLANAIVLPYVMEYNLPQVPDRTVAIAEALGEDIDRRAPARREGYRAVRAVRELASSVRVPRTLEATAAERDAIPELAERSLSDGSVTGNPRIADREDMAGVLERAFDGTFEYEDVL